MQINNERTSKQPISRQWAVDSRQLISEQHPVCNRQLVTYRRLPTAYSSILSTAYCLLKCRLLPTAYCILISCTLITSCYEPKEGCLDAEAINFDANADDPCPNCCTYPSLKVSFLHKVATSDTTTATLLYNSPYTFDSIQFFKINRIRFYISDLQLLHSDGSLNTGTDSVDLKIPQESGDTSEIRVPNNFILVDKNNFQSKSLGNFRKSGNFDGIQFKVGITTPANHADPNQLSDEHPLSLQEESMHWNTDDGYIFNQISLSRNTLTRDSILVEYGTDDKLKMRSINESFFIPEGFNITLVLQINYLHWFEGIDFETETTTTMANKIVDRVAASISLVDVKLE